MEDLIQFTYCTAFLRNPLGNIHQNERADQEK